MPGFCLCKCYLVKVLRGFEHASRSKHTKARNIARVWLCEGYAGL